LDTTDNELQLHALNRLIVVLLYQGRLHTKEGLAAFQLAESRLSNSGDLILKFFVKLNRAVWHLEVGELSQAKAAFESVHPVLKGTNATDALAWLALNEGELSLKCMDLGTAEERFGEAERLLRPSSPAAFSTIVNAGLGLCALKSGDLSEARKREADLPSLPDYWTFDPSVIVDFKASMFRRRGDVQNAIDLLAEVAENVKGRLTTVWIKLMIERARLLRTHRPSTAKDVLEEVNAVVVDLGLFGRARTIQRLLDL
jgi:tetratricopeptide (TPR) repeat protein